MSKKVLPFKQKVEEEKICCPKGVIEATETLVYIFKDIDSKYSDDPRIARHCKKCKDMLLDITLRSALIMEEITGVKVLDD